MNNNGNDNYMNNDNNKKEEVQIGIDWRCGTVGKATRGGGIPYGLPVHILAAHF